MPRSPRIEFPGAMYHVLAMGNRREAIVLSVDDRWMFLRTLGEMAGRTGIRIHAYALMANHYHLVIETPKANLVDGMKWLQTTYTPRFNVKNRLWGHLFGGRYKAIVVQHQEGEVVRAQLIEPCATPAQAGCGTERVQCAGVEILEDAAHEVGWEAMNKLFLCTPGSIDRFTNPLQPPNMGALPLWQRPPLRLPSGRAVSCQRCPTLPSNPINTSRFQRSPPEIQFCAVSAV
jgi:REP element-mobilizing transposase RayT